MLITDRSIFVGFDLLKVDLNRLSINKFILPLFEWVVNEQSNSFKNDEITHFLPFVPSNLFK